MVEAIFEGLLLREQTGGTQDCLPGLEEFLKPKAEDLDLKWKNAAEREKRSRTMFAQEGIKADDVQRELEEERAAVGSSADVRDFVCTALEMNGAVVDARKDGAVRLDLGALPQALQDAIRAEGADGGAGKLRARFEMPVGDDEVYLSRTHPLVSGLASYVMDAALDPVLQEGDSGRPVARRCGAIRTGQVATRTTVLLDALSLPGGDQARGRGAAGAARRGVPRARLRGRARERALAGRRAARGAAARRRPTPTSRPSRPPTSCRR